MTADRTALPDSAKLYAERDTEELGDYYLRHIDHMTREDLYYKSDIAAELAWRDREIDRLQSLRPAGEGVDGTWLWGKLMDWCRKNGTSPAEQGDLFLIASEAHRLFPAGSPSSAALVGLEWLERLERLLVNAHTSLTDEVIVDIATRIVREALTAAEAQGDYVRVPRVPTPKMIDATWDHEIDRDGGIESQGTRNRRIWDAMLAAAGAQEKGNG